MERQGGEDVKSDTDGGREVSAGNTAASNKQTGSSCNIKK